MGGRPLARPEWLGFAWASDPIKRDFGGELILKSAKCVLLTTRANLGIKVTFGWDFI